MVVENAYLNVIGGREEDFEDAFARGRPILAGAEGCERVELFRDAERPSSYLLRVTWQRLEDHLGAFPGSAAGRRFAELVAGFFAEEPQVRHFAATEVAR
jgi:heme-degrading monooxygenase HmoA